MSTSFAQTLSITFTSAFFLQERADLDQNMPDALYERIEDAFQAVLIWLRSAWRIGDRSCALPDKTVALLS